MKIIQTFGLLFLLLLSSSCAKTFYSPDAQNLAENHRLVAIVPPVVTIEATKKMTPQDVTLQQQAESRSFQQEMYSWMLKRKSQGKIKPEIQDLQTTNAKLTEAGYPGKMLTTAEMCDVLGVDGLITSNYHLSKPMSEGAAVVTTILIGVGTTNEVHASLNINDCSQQKLMWNYDQKFSGGIGSSPSRLVDGLMREASKKMPYVKK